MFQMSNHLVLCQIYLDLLLMPGTPFLREEQILLQLLEEEQLWQAEARDGKNKNCYKIL